jgi:hypothetical protein
LAWHHEDSLGSHSEVLLSVPRELQDLAPNVWCHCLFSCDCQSSTHSGPASARPPLALRAQGPPAQKLCLWPSRLTPHALFTPPFRQIPAIRSHSRCSLLLWDMNYEWTWNWFLRSHFVPFRMLEKALGCLAQDRCKNSVWDGKQMKEADRNCLPRWSHWR